MSRYKIIGSKTQVCNFINNYEVRLEKLKNDSGDQTITDIQIELITDLEHAIFYGAEKVRFKRMSGNE